MTSLLAEDLVQILADDMTLQHDQPMWSTRVWNQNNERFRKIGWTYLTIVYSEV